MAQKRQAKESIKHEIVEDLRVCIAYSPDTENDLLCMVERYKKERQHREQLKENMKNLLNGEQYMNPFAIYYRYTEEDIEAFETIIDTYITTLENIGLRDVYQVGSAFDLAVAELNKLNDKTNGELIDDWRKPKLEALLLLCAEDVRIPLAKARLNTYKGW